ncbi:MAG: phosphotransferase [Thermoleophilia bacterium]|nr:phosphotransferase [Thermoleophilia bacterium]
MSGRSTSAVAAAVAIARDEGLETADAVVLRDAWHVLVHLRPLPVVARVSADASSPDIEPEQVARELAVARHAAAAGAPVVPPADELDPGPHRRGGRVVTFWRFVEARGELDARAAGRGLREIHEALADYGDALPAAGHPDDTARMLDALRPSADVELLRRAASARPAGAGQALHGDAHLGNCLPAPAGPLWHDLETTCRGPREYDLAALVLGDRVGRDRPAARAALRAYGAHDADLLDAWLPVYAAWVYASMLVALPRRPGLATPLAERLAWLRGRVD